VRPLEERTFFLIEIRLKGAKVRKAPPRDLAAALPKLPDFLRSLVEEGRYVAAGEWTTQDGGLVMFRANDLAEAARIARRHPFHGKRFAELEVHEWSARWNLWNLMGAGRFVRRR